MLGQGDQMLFVLGIVVMFPELNLGDEDRPTLRSTTTGVPSMWYTLVSPAITTGEGFRCRLSTLNRSFPLSVQVH